MCTTSPWLTFSDTSTAEFNLTAFTDDPDRTKLETLIEQIKPKELVLEKGQVSKPTLRLLKRCLEASQFNFLVSGLEFWDVEHTIDEVRRAAYFSFEEGAADYRGHWPAPLKTDTPDISAFGAWHSTLGPFAWTKI